MLPPADNRDLSVITLAVEIERTAPPAPPRERPDSVEILCAADRERADPRSK